MEPACPNPIRVMSIFQAGSDLRYVDENRRKGYISFEYGRGEEETGGMVALGEMDGGSMLLVGEETPELAEEVAARFMELTGLKEIPASPEVMHRCLRATGITQQYMREWLELMEKARKED